MQEISTISCQVRMKESSAKAGQDFSCLLLTKSVKQLSVNLPKLCQEAPTAGCSPGVKHDNRASKAGPRPPGPHPTDTTRGSRTDPGTAAGVKQESRLPHKSVVTRQVQGQATKSVHRSGCKVRGSPARHRHV